MAEALTAGSETYFVGLLLHLFFKKKKMEQLLHLFSQQMGYSIAGTFARLESNYVTWPCLDLRFY